MEAQPTLQDLVEWAIWALVACGALYVLWHFRHQLLRRERLVLGLANALPWLVVAWFLLAVGGCFAAVSRIGAGSTDIPLILKIGGFGFPLLLPLSMFIRKVARRRWPVPGGS